MYTRASRVKMAEAHVFHYFAGLSKCRMAILLLEYIQVSHSSVDYYILGTC